MPCCLQCLEKTDLPITDCLTLTEQRLVWMWRRDSFVGWRGPLTLAGVASLKTQNNICVLQLSLCDSFFWCLFLLHPFPLLPPSLSSPTLPFTGWSARYVVLFNMQSPFLFLYYCLTGSRGPFLWPDNGRRRDREHGGHVPFATLRYLSILPPFTPTVRFSIAP